MVDVIFSFGGWSIKESAVSHSDYLRCWAIHDCCGTAGGWYTVETPEVCRVCKEPVPDEVQGLLLMLLN